MASSLTPSALPILVQVTAGPVRPSIHCTRTVPIAAIRHNTPIAYRPPTMSYSITINSSAAARSLAVEKGYNVIFSKRVDTDSDGKGAQFNTAWFVLNPNDMGDSITVSWDATMYSATYNDYHTSDGDKIEMPHDIVELQPGGPYQVDVTGTMGIDETRPVDESSRPAFTFSNNSYYTNDGYDGDYYPVLLTQDPVGNKVPCWAASQGMERNVA
jgi:hypothetical protein